MIRITIEFKKAEKRIREFEKLACTLERLTEAIMKEILQIPGSVLKRMRRGGISGARAGARLRRIIDKKTKEDL